MKERKIACDILLRVENGGYSNLLLATREVTPFITALVYGNLERRITLDELLAPFIKGKLDIEVATILRLSAYQLKFMESVPEYAVINEGVKLCRAYKKTSASGLVNAILRKVKSVPLPNTETAVYSLHPKILSAFKRDYPNDYKKIAENSLLRPKTCIYTNLTKTTPEKLSEILAAEGVKTYPGIAENTFFCEGEPPTKTTAFAEGLFHVVGSCSALTAQGVVATGAKNILDLCAAPGGKTAIMAMSAERVVACDVSDGRVSAMKTQLKRLSLNNVECVQNDATEQLPDTGFDAVLCDVPCSGTGVISHKPELRFTPPRTEGLIDTQYKILKNASTAVRVGGMLCYSSCTLSREENEQQIEQFLSENEGFKPMKLPFNPPDFCELRQGSITFFPNCNNFDGFFVAFLEKVW